MAGSRQPEPEEYGRLTQQSEMEENMAEEREHKNNAPEGGARTEGCSFIDTDKESLTLTYEDGRDVRCTIVRIFQTPAQKYIVLIPEDGSTKGTAYLYHFDTDDEGAPVVTQIESEDEYREASEIFEAMTKNIDLTEDET